MTLIWFYPLENLISLKLVFNPIENRQLGQTVAKQVEVVAVIELFFLLDDNKITLKKMKKITVALCLLFTALSFSQNQPQDSVTIYKKRVLEKSEVDFLSSYYTQSGNNAAVTGGIGNEKLSDFATDIVVAIPLNDDDIFNINATISAYTSASSSNLDPFDKSGASRRGDNEEDRAISSKAASGANGSPWVESSGASKSDVWAHGDFGYSHSSDNRNKIWSANINFATEFDYTSFGFGSSYNWLFNQKDTEIGIKGNIYLDTWNPRYPTELDSYLEANKNLNNGFFSGVDILNQNGNSIDKNGPVVWSPLNTTLVNNKSRNTYSFSLNFSQIINKNAQISFFLDLIQQDGWLSSPMQRVYFGDRANYYIGNAASIPNYTSSTNKDVFQLADDIERLPSSRFKTPIGMRFNYYINERLVLRTYYRYYTDDWGVSSHTAQIELPIKVSDMFTLYPSYRYYTQTAADYFAPYEQALSTQEFYTSDYDLSGFDANQYGFGIKYTDIFTKLNVWKLHLKSAQLKYSHYNQSSGLSSNIISLGFNYIFE